MLDELIENGFNTQEAMEFCANQESIYRTVLESALEEGQSKIPLLKKCAETKDFERYKIEVHGLKNVAKTIGATDLFMVSNAQNESAKDGETEELWVKNEALLAVYQKTLQLIDMIVIKG